MRHPARPALTGLVVPKTPVEALLFETPTVAVGQFRCAPDDRLFADSGPSNAYCFVFPRTSVWIRHAGAAPFVAHPGLVTYYNEGQEYSRRPVSHDGDRAEWFAVAPGVLEESLACVAPHTLGRGRRIFRPAHGPSDPVTYLRQRQLVHRLRRHPGTDPLAVEEAVLGLLARVVCRQGGAPPPAPSRARRDLVEGAKVLLARTLSERVRVSDLAAQLGCSVFHLCRTFRSVEGTTMQAYRNDLRLRGTLEAMLDRQWDLSRVALDAGFSSHSHFTAAFRARFGETPSAVARSR
jgi:AraC family transcriptional regulator